MTITAVSMCLCFILGEWLVGMFRGEGVIWQPEEEQEGGQEGICSLEGGG